MTPQEHLAEADRLIDNATNMSVSDAQELLMFAQFHIQIAQAAAALGVRDDLGRFVDLAAEEARTASAVRRAAATPGD